MEFAAMVRSVLKLSAGIQLALRSSLGRAGFLCQLALEQTAMFIHDSHLQKTCEKPGDSWMLLSQDAFKKKERTPFHAF